MTEKEKQEIKLACIELAIGKTQIPTRTPEEVVAAAKLYYEFIKNA